MQTQSFNVGKDASLESIHEAILNLSDLDHDECSDLLETLQQLDAHADVAHFKTNLQSLHSAPTLQQARALLNRELRFFGEPSPGLSLEGCEMHQRLLAAYSKLHSQSVAA
jgi:ribosomal protein S12 methylthiotransferase accessory factor